MPRWGRYHIPAVTTPGPMGEKGAEWWHQSVLGGGIARLLQLRCEHCTLVDRRAVAALGIKANIASQYGDADDNAIITVRFPKALRTS